MLFTLVATAFFAVGLYSYLNPDNTLLGEESGVSLGFVLVFPFFAFFGIMMLLLGRSFLRKAQADLDRMDVCTTDDDLRNADHQQEN